MDSKYSSWLSTAHARPIGITPAINFRLFVLVVVKARSALEASTSSWKPRGTKVNLESFLPRVHCLKTSTRIRPWIFLRTKQMFSTELKGSVHPPRTMIPRYSSFDKLLGLLLIDFLNGMYLGPTQILEFVFGFHFSDRLGWITKSALNSGVGSSEIVTICLYLLLWINSSSTNIV
jgi:hypothetical protein